MLDRINNQTCDLLDFLYDLDRGHDTPTVYFSSYQVANLRTFSAFTQNRLSE